MIEIRLARAEDAIGIVTVIRNGFSLSLLEKIIYGCPGITKYIQDLIKLPVFLSDTMYIVAVTEDQVVGCVELRFLRDEIFLNYISVLSNFRSRGIGNRLLEAALNSIDQDRYTKLRLDVFSQNTIARTWYKSLGFQYEYSIGWWDIPIWKLDNSDSAIITGYPQAQVCQEKFGFSQFSLITQNGEYSVGRIGHNWFWLIQPDALIDPGVTKTLSHLDADRHILALIQERQMPPSVEENSQKVAGTERMCIELKRLKFK
ncbi:MAG: GNAT family N-acetyltransferase [Thermodesulfobacteriota bacterium]|nr:GNAT family N-acetyltransferase [Thermodesulfobacteriota bacterium]